MLEILQGKSHKGKNIYIAKQLMKSSEKVCYVNMTVRNVIVLNSYQ